MTEIEKESVMNLIGNMTEEAMKYGIYFKTVCFTTDEEYGAAQIEWDYYPKYEPCKITITVKKD